MFNSRTGLIFIFFSMISYFSCLIYSGITLVSSGVFILFPLLATQKIAHILFLIGLFLAKDEIVRMKFNPVTVLSQALSLAAPSLGFLLVFSGVFLLAEVTSGGNILFEAINAVIYLNLYFVYGRNR